MKLQFDLGADLTVAFDDHEYKDDEAHLKKSIELTQRWALRCKREYNKRYPELGSGSIKKEIPKPASPARCDAEGAKRGEQVRNDGRPLLYGVIHGGTNKKLRIKSAKFTDKYFEAIAIGGIYGTKKQMYEMIDYTQQNTSSEKIKHLLGIGEIEDLFEGIGRGIDMFDCVAPTRRARNGSLYISPKSGGGRKNNFTFNISSSKFKIDMRPVDSECGCYTCLNFSRAYLRHLYLGREILFHQLATYHNIYFITKLVEIIREAIKSNSLSKLKSHYN